jgi:hypothetical protein
MAARQHGVDTHRMELLVRELARACDGSSVDAHAQAADR